MISLDLILPLFVAVAPAEPAAGSEITIAIISGSVALILGLSGTYLSYRTTMAKIRAEIKDENDKKEEIARLKEIGKDVSDTEDKNERDAKLAAMVSNTMRTMLAQMQSQLDIKEKIIQEQEARMNKRETDFAKEIARVESSFNKRIGALEQQLQETLEKLKDREEGIDILTAQLKARNEEPIYKRKKTGELKTGE